MPELFRRCARLLAPTLALSLAAAPGCKDPADPAGPAGSAGSAGSAGQRSTPLAYEEVPAGGRADVREVAAASYRRSLVQQLDLVPAGVDDYLVIRDLRPLILQARLVEQILAGPLTRAIPALAKIGGGDGEARLEQLRHTQETLALVLAGLEGAGIELDVGMVLADPEGSPILLFAAEDMQRLGMLASLLGEQGIELAAGCGPVAMQPGWVACSTRGPEGLAAYAPGKAGAVLAQRLATTQVGVDLERVNVALSLGGGQDGEGRSGSIDATLRTDPELWELTVPMPESGSESAGASASEGEVLRSGPAPGLRALVPGTSFAWLRLDPTGFAEGGPAGFAGQILTGELLLGAVDRPNGIIVQAGISDASEAAKAVQRMAQTLPGSAIEPEQLAGVRVEFDRASIDLDGKLVPSIGLSLGGEGAAAWQTTLGVDARARLWAYGDYLSFAIGEVQEIPAAIGRLRGAGPSPATVAALPPTLARALLAGEVGLALHLVLDHWQAPPSEAELADLLAGLPEDSRPDVAAITALFTALAPWSSLDLWIRRADDRWLAQLTVVPFAAPGPEVGADEARAAAAVVDAVLTGATTDAGQAAYAELLERYPQSPRAPSYRARLGRAPAHHAAVGMIEISAIAALALPTFTRYLQQAKTAEAVAETQAILDAALTQREKAGNCASLLGKAGPTPSLEIACHAGDGGKCRASEGAIPADPAGRYPMQAWTDDPIWSAIGWRPQGAHRFHYALEARAEGDSCRIIVEARGDLDGDGQLSSYVREASVAADGSRRSPPLRVEQGDE